MDNMDVKNAGENGGNTTLPVSNNTKRRVVEAVERMNKKERGRKIKIDELIAALLDRLDGQLEKKLQEATLSTMDLIEEEHAKYSTEHGEIPFDQFLRRGFFGAKTAVRGDAE